MCLLSSSIRLRCNTAYVAQPEVFVMYVRSTNRERNYPRITLGDRSSVQVLENPLTLHSSNNKSATCFDKHH